MHTADFFVHFSNVLLLISYSVRNMLWLRWFAVGASLAEMPYFLLQRNVLWPPVLWAIVFTGLNLYQIALIYMQQRAVVLSEDEQKLYELGFKSIPPREFVSLVLAGEWRDAAPGDRPITEGELVSELCIAVRGAIRVTRKGEDLGTVQPGQVLGLSPALTGHPSPISVAFTEPGRYLRWPLSNIRALLEAKPELRGTVQNLVNQDLARKLERALSSVPQSANEAAQAGKMN